MITVFVLVHVPVSGQAQGVHEEIPPNPSHFGNPHIDCLAVTILQVNDDGTATVMIDLLLVAPALVVCVVVFFSSLKAGGSEPHKLQASI